MGGRPLTQSHDTFSIHGRGQGVRVAVLAERAFCAPNGLQGDGGDTFGQWDLSTTGPLAASTLTSAL